MDKANEDSEILHAKINQETAKIPWKALQRLFAQSRVIRVAPTLDLVDVVAAAAADHSDKIQAWVLEGRITKVSDEQARSWLECDAILWTVVVKPWVFTQEQQQPARHPLRRDRREFSQ